MTETNETTNTETKEHAATTPEAYHVISRSILMSLLKILETAKTEVQVGEVVNAVKALQTAPFVNIIQEAAPASAPVENTTPAPNPTIPVLESLPDSDSGPVSQAV